MSETKTQKEHNKQVLDQLIENPDLIEDKRWRMDNLYWIITKAGKKSVFKMNRAQQHFFENYLVKPGSIYHRHIILKSRQLGFTTFINLYILDEILFNPNREGLVVAHKVTDAAEIFDRKVDFALRNMDDYIKDAYFKMTRNSAKKIQITIEDGTEKGAMSSLAVSTSGRSGTFFYVHISEFAKMCVDPSVLTPS